MVNWSKSWLIIVTDDALKLTIPIVKHDALKSAIVNYVQTWVNITKKWLATVKHGERWLNMLHYVSPWLKQTLLFERPSFLKHIYRRNSIVLTWVLFKERTLPSLIWWQPIDEVEHSIRKPLLNSLGEDILVSSCILESHYARGHYDFHGR